MTNPLPQSNPDWQSCLTPEQYRILREKGTEQAFTGEYYGLKDAGMYKCAGCGQELFRSDEKYDSGTGWPSFWQPVSDDKIEAHEDVSMGMRRIEVTCRNCGGHLGHVFPDGPNPTGLRYCINSAALKFAPKADLEAKTGD